jgi:hypothetical protein
MIHGLLNASTNLAAHVGNGSAYIQSLGFDTEFRTAGNRMKSGISVCWSR